MSQPSLRILLYQTQHFSEHPLLRRFGSSAASGELWQGIKGDPATIPPNTARSFYDADYISTDSDPTPEALKGPVWVGGPKSFLAYGADFRGDPRVEAAIDLPWFLSPLTSSDEFMDADDPEQISSDLMKKICSDLSRALDIVELLDGRGGVLDGVVNRSYTGVDLTARAGVDVVRDEIRIARCVLDERTAAINYGLLHTQMGSLAWIDKHYGAYLKEWRLLGRMRGALLDLKNFQPARIPILDMLGKDVALYYPLGEPYRATFNEEEVRGLQRIATGKQFCSWLARTDVRPPLDLSQPSLWPEYRRPLEERLTSPEDTPPISRLIQMEEMSSRLKTALGDLLLSTVTASLDFEGLPPVLVVGSARLIIEPITELRMMAWAIDHRTAALADILREATRRGWSFRLVYPASFLDTIRIARDRFLPNYPALRYHNIPYLDEERGWQQLWGDQGTVAVELLQQPHGRAFLFEGGVVWRLALLWGAPFVASWRLDGLIPSASVTSLHGGRTEPDGFRGDAVSELEAQLMIGTVRHGESGLTLSWFPSTEMLVRHGYCNGEWTNLAEAIIRTRFDSLQHGERTYRPLSDLQWEEELLKSSPDKLLRDSFVHPNQDEIDDLLQETRREMRKEWHGSTLSDIASGIGIEEDAWWRN